MKNFLLLPAILLVHAFLYAQSGLKIKVIHADTQEPLPGATIKIGSAAKIQATDSTGTTVFTNLLPGSHDIIVSHIGYGEYKNRITVPVSTELVIELEPEEEEEEEVIIQSTRTSRTIRNTPTRVEVIGLEEIDEKSNMRPGNVSMLLHESTGIQMQQTSATSGNSSIRIQGLDGRYTQLLKDGFASFGNFASGLSVLEIPPLDLKQVEIIKGPASTLYGGGSIAGVVNFVSKTPGAKPENSILLNYSNIGQANIAYFSAGRNKKIGYTFLGMINRQKEFDVDKDDFTEIPRSRELTLHPKLFVYLNEKNTLILGNSFSTGNRKGGDLQAVKGVKDPNHTFFEENNTLRNITTFEWIGKPMSNKTISLKQSLAIFDRHIEIPTYHFDGMSVNSFTDASYLFSKENHSLVTGFNMVYDKFNEKNGSAGNRDNTNLTIGGYFQDTWDINEKLKLESGLRLDYVRYNNSLFSNSDVMVLPRVSLLVKYNNKLSSRIGGGLGYKVPTLFTERTETFQYQGVLQLNNVKAEKSYGSTADINYTTSLGHDFNFSFNNLFFYTWIDRPLVLQEDGFGNTFFSNASRPVQTMGFETNAKLIYRHNYKLFLGYTYTDARAKYLTGNQFLPLIPKHKFNSALIYEKHEFLKLGFEAYYTSQQYLFNGFRTSDFWELGFMAEKLFEKFSVYINFENFTDTRQSRFKQVSSGPHTAPVFDDIWTHTEGFVVNGGIKIRL